MTDAGVRVLLIFLALASLGSAAPPPFTKGRMTLNQLRSLAASVGFPDPVLAAAIAMAESGGNPLASSIIVHPAPGNGPERSFGLWQINTLAHPNYDETQLLDAQYNARAALAISKNGADFTPWAAYTKGLYRRYMTP